MVTTELINYIRGLLQKGISEEEIMRSLILKGWSQQDIQQAVIQAKGEQSPGNTSISIVQQNPQPNEAIIHSYFFRLFHGRLNIGTYLAASFLLQFVDYMIVENLVGLFY